MTAKTSNASSFIRYAQCWEDADILLKALDVGVDDVCLSIASAGDNTLSLLSQTPAQVVAVDVNPAQIACLALRVAAYTRLSHDELLQLVGSSESTDREALYRRCRSALSTETRNFWDSNLALIRGGIGNAGRFEQYFAIFRNKVLPWVHNKRRVERLLVGGTQSDRRYFYRHVWNNWRWRLLFRIFCSRLVMGKLGRDPEYFCYAQGSVTQHILTRLDHAVTELDPSKNPYLHWILRGHHTTVLPHALRPENFVAIRDNLHRLQWHCMSVDEFLTAHPQLRFNCFNLSDIFEYMSRDDFHKLLQRLVNSSHRGARFAYWNMMAERGRPAEMAHILTPQSELAARLHYQDKAFFYSRFVVETVTQHADLRSSNPC